MQQTQNTSADKNQVPAQKGLSGFALTAYALLKTICVGSVQCLALVIAVFATVELIFAAAHIGEDTVVKPDPLLGYSHMENKSSSYRQEGYSKSTTNALGFRDRNYPLIKAADTTRIAVLGDSMTVGMEVPPDKTFCKLLEKRLKSEQNANYEVMNCGISGFGTGQEYLVYRQKVEQFHPDIVLVAYNYGDSDDNVFQRSGMNPPRPVFRDEQGNLQIDWHDIDKWYASNDARYYASFEWLRRNCRVLAVLSKLNLDLSNSDPTYQMICSKVAPPIEYIWDKFLSLLPSANSDMGNARECAKPSSVDSTNTVKNSSPNTYSTASEMQKIFLANRAKTDVALAIFRALNNECKKNNCKLVVAFGPALTNSMFYYRELADISKQAKLEGYSVIEANRAFPPRAPMEISPNFFGLHFTRAGHQIMSDAIYKGLFARQSTQDKAL